MPAFTDLAGIPMTAHVPLLRDTLRGQMGFDGVLISDYNAIAELLRHGVAADLAEAAALALNAGVDIDMMANAYRKGLPVALERGLVSVEQIDAAVRRVLRLKEALGLFEDPYRRGAKPEEPAALVARRELARSVAVRSMVLLKNDDELLPFRDAPGCLAVIGPLADAGSEMRGPWWAAGETEPHVSVLAGLREGFPDTELLHAAGVGIKDESEDGVAAAVELCERADAVILCLGEGATMSGEAASRAYPELPGRQRTLAEAVLARTHKLDKPVIVILFSGRPLVLPWLAERTEALLAAWFPGTEAGNAIADLLRGRISPSGRTPMSWPCAVGQAPVYFGQRPSGRPFDAKDYFTSKYLDVPNEPLYPFGHGLSYGSFRYAALRVAPDQVEESGRIEVEVDLVNEGAHAAEETVFLFSRDKVASVTRPLLELRGFGKLRLGPGGNGTVKLGFAASELRFLGQDLQPVFEPGEVEILAGPNADRTQLLSATVVLK